MTSGVAVSDASPLIALHQIDRLELLHDLFAMTVVPTVVAEEVAPSLGMLPRWIGIQDADRIPPFPRRVDAGERAAIALAIQLASDAVILDDLAGRLAAAELGLRAIGSLGLLVRAKRMRLIEEVRPLMDGMVANGLFTSEQLRFEILNAAGETER